MDPNFWRGKRVFVTGHTGFKGSWLCLWLQMLGAEVTGYALPPPTRPSLFEVADIAAGMHSRFGDILDFERLSSAVAGARPDIVFHMAAQPLVRASYQRPVATFNTNVMGTVHLLEAIRERADVIALVNVTTDKCYENREWVWSYRENEPLGGYDPYSSSKGCAELVTAAYRSSFFADSPTAVATARAGNVIGGGDWAQDRLLPDVLRAFAADEPVRLRNPAAIRPWQHVLEPLRGYMQLAERLYTKGDTFAEAWNFGPNEQDAKSVGWVVQHLAQLWGEGAAWEVDQGEQPHEATYLKLDISKSRGRLSWQPALSLTQALGWTVDWTRANLTGQNMHEYSSDQIRAYEHLISLL